MALVDIIELVKPETGEKFYPYAHLNGLKGGELLPRIGSPIQTTLSTAIYPLKDALGVQFYPQTHAEAVIGLSQMIEDNQFFVKESDGNGGYRIKLKDGFTGLYGNGWIASGGIGTGNSGGGGGIIQTVWGENKLGQIYSQSGTDNLTETFSAFAIDKIWQAVVALQQTTPNVSLVNGADYSTITVNGTSALFFTKDQTLSLIGSIQQFHYEIYASTSAVSNPSGSVLYLIGPTGTGADKYEEYVYDSTKQNPWVKIGDTSIDLSNYIQKVSGATSGNFAGLNASGEVVDSGHKHGDYVTALGTSGNYLTWTKNGTTSNITVPFATNATTATKIGTATVGSTAKPVYINAGVPTLLGTVGTSTMPVYLNNGTITQISSFKEAYLSWGGKDFSGSYGPIDAAMVSELGACRTMFLKAAGIVVEYSTDAGETWQDYGATDAQKVGLFSYGNSFVIGKASAATASVNNMLRVTMHTSAAGIYTTLNKFVIFVTTSGSTGCYCTIRCRTQQNYEDDVDTWSVRADHVPISGWSGYNVINISGTATYGNTKSSQYGEWQFIFGCTGHSGNYAGLSVSKIFGFGGVGWTCPSTMAKTGHLYSYDANQNATFPAAIYANVNDSALGSTSKRWKMYGTTLDLSGAATIGGNVTLGETLTLATGTSGAPTIHFKRGTDSDTYYDWKIQDSGGHLYFKLSSGGTDATHVDLYDTYSSIQTPLNVNGALTFVGSTAATRRIYFGDVNHYLELDANGFHFVGAGLYGDMWVSAGGIGTGGGGGSAGELNDLADVTINSQTIANGNLLVYNSATSHWENKPQSEIVPTISVVNNAATLTAEQTLTLATVAGTAITVTVPEFATRTWVLGQNFLQPADVADFVTSTELATELADYVPNTRKVNGHALSSDVTVTKGDVGLGNVENTALSTWAGTANITTVGTIASGTWNGTPIANNKIANSFVTIAGNNVALGASLSANTLRTSLGIPTIESNIATIMSWFSEDANGNIVVNPKNGTARGFYNSGWISNGGVGSGGGSGSGTAAWGTVTDTTVQLTVDNITRVLTRGDKNKIVFLTEQEYANIATPDADTIYMTYEE